MYSDAVALFVCIWVVNLRVKLNINKGDIYKYTWSTWVLKMLSHYSILLYFNNKHLSCLCDWLILAKPAESSAQTWPLYRARSAPSPSAAQTTPQWQQAQRPARTAPRAEACIGRPPAGRRARGTEAQRGRKLWAVSVTEGCNTLDNLTLNLAAWAEMCCSSSFLHLLFVLCKITSIILNPSAAVHAGICCLLTAFSLPTPVSASESATVRTRPTAYRRRCSRWNRDWGTRRGNERSGCTGGPSCSTSAPGQLWPSACWLSGCTPSEALWVT